MGVSYRGHVEKKKGIARTIAAFTATDRKCASALGFNCRDVPKGPQSIQEVASKGPMLRTIVPGDGHCLLRAVLEQTITCFGRTSQTKQDRKG